jgi:hypothetical protein
MSRGEDYKWLYSMSLSRQMVMIHANPKSSRTITIIISKPSAPISSSSMLYMRSKMTASMVMQIRKHLAIWQN